MPSEMRAVRSRLDRGVGVNALNLEGKLELDPVPGHPLTGDHRVATLHLWGNRLPVDGDREEPFRERGAPVELAHVWIRDAQLDRQAPGSGGVHNEGHFAVLRIVGDLDELEVPELHPAAHVQVDVNAVVATTVYPGRKPQQGAGDVADAAGAAVPRVARGRAVERVLVGEVLPLQVHAAQEPVVESLFEHVGVPGVRVGPLEPVLEEDEAAAGAGLAVARVREGVVFAEALVALAGANGAGEVELVVHDAVPDRSHGPEVGAITALQGDARHPAVQVAGAYGVPHRLRLRDGGTIGLIELFTTAATVEQEARQGEVPVTLTRSLVLLYYSERSASELSGCGQCLS